MLQLEMVEGQGSRRRTAVRRYPFWIGRGSECDLQVRELGIWDRHAQLHCRPSEGIFLEVAPGALARVNGQVVQRTRLRNGDVLQMGDVQWVASLSPVQASGFRLREIMVWVGLGALGAIQALLLYFWLP